MSQILRRGSVQRLATLFNLFPVKALRAEWADLDGAKDTLVLEVVANRAIDRLSRFIHNNLSLCKQHVYLFSSNITAEAFNRLQFTDLDALALPDGADITKRSFLTEIHIQIAIWTDPPQREVLDYFLPLKIEFREGYIVVRFVKFEKNITLPGVDIANIQVRTSHHEQEILTQIGRDVMGAGFTFVPTDLHRGVKHLWDIDEIDGFQLSYSTPDSIDSKRMNDKRGLKQYNRPVYDSLRNATFFGCLFRTLVAEGVEPLIVTINLSTGFISFSKFTERGQTDELIEQILANN